MEGYVPYISFYNFYIDFSWRRPGLLGFITRSPPGAAVLFEHIARYLQHRTVQYSAVQYSDRPAVQQYKTGARRATILWRILAGRYCDSCMGRTLGLLSGNNDCLPGSRTGLQVSCSAGLIRLASWGRSGLFLLLVIIMGGAGLCLHWLDIHRITIVIARYTRPASPHQHRSTAT